MSLSDLDFAVRVACGAGALAALSNLGTALVLLPIVDRRQLPARWRHGLYAVVATIGLVVIAFPFALILGRVAE